MHHDERSEIAHDPARSTKADRRVAPRYSLVEPAEVEIESWKELVALYTKDISHGGMFIQTDAPPAHDTQVAVRLRLPGGAGTLELEGVVVHVVTAVQARAMECTAGFGLQFSNLTRERRSALQRLVEQAKAVASECSTGELPMLRELGSSCVPGQDGNLRLTLTEAEHRTLQELRAELASMMARSDLEVLGLTGPIDRTALRAVFERLAWRWHPSVIQSDAPPEIRRLSEEIFVRVQEAYRRLRGATASTSAPQASAPQASAPQASVPQASVPQPPRMHEPQARVSRSAMDELAERSEQLAAGLKRRATTTTAAPRDEHRALVDEALRLIADKRYVAAIERLELVLERAPEPRLRVLLRVVQARQALVERDFPRARAHYEAVLELEPGHELAKRELLMLSAVRR